MSQVADSQKAERTPLLPHRRVWPRLAVLIGLVAFMAIGSPTLLNLLGFTLFMTAALGTFPRHYVSREEFVRELCVVFVPVHVARYSLKSFEEIETDIEERVPAIAGVFIGVINLLWVWALDHLFPWVGGDFKIWLRTFSGKRVLGWQGDGEARFRENLKILEDHTGLPVTRR